MTPAFTTDVVAPPFTSTRAVPLPRLSPDFPSGAGAALGDSVAVDAAMSAPAVPSAPAMPPAMAPTISPAMSRAAGAATVAPVPASLLRASDTRTGDPLAGTAVAVAEPGTAAPFVSPTPRLDLDTPAGMVVPPLAPADVPAAADAVTHHEQTRQALLARQELEPVLPIAVPTRRAASFGDFRPDPLLEASFAASSTPTCLVDIVSGRSVIGRANAAFVRLAGWPPAELIGADPLLIAGSQTDPVSLDVLRRALGTGAAARVAILGARKDGTAYWSEVTVLPVRDLSRTLIGAVVEHRDLSRELAAEARGWRGHHVDPTTGLAARSLVEAEITRLCSGAMPFALLSCAVTGLDAVNAVEGEATGDDLLAAAGRRLAEIVGTAGRVGRHTGASYTVIIEGSTREEADALAARVEQAFADRPLSTQHAVGMTVGGAVFPEDARGAAALQHAAVRQREAVRRLAGSRWARARARFSS